MNFFFNFIVPIGYHGEKTGKMMPWTQGATILVQQSFVMRLENSQGQELLL
jgi:hypothetical protein